MTHQEHPIAIVSKKHYFLRLKYFLLGYKVIVRRGGFNPYREKILAEKKAYEEYQQQQREIRECLAQRGGEL